MMSPGRYIMQGRGYQRFSLFFAVTDIQEKDKNEAKNGQNRARERKEREEKSKSKVKKSTGSRSSQSQPREVALERASKTKPENLNC
ncbi:hypothetical protein Tco_0738977 [Tanacetum coccineum]